MERLAHIIQAGVDDKSWTPITVSRNGPHISRLFFVDDLMLFARASTMQMDVILDCLNIFSASFGQKVNLIKSLILFSPNVPRRTAQDISSMSGIPLASSLGRYLGVRICDGRIARCILSGVIERVRRRLFSWKPRFFSLAGRHTLIKSVASSIPLYTMQTYKLLKSSSDELDQINRNFLWGHRDGRNRLHLLNWKTCCLPKDCGGLGLSCTEDMNVAMLMKLVWEMLIKNIHFGAACCLLNILKIMTFSRPKNIRLVPLFGANFFLALSLLAVASSGVFITGKPHGFGKIGGSDRARLFIILLLLCPILGKISKLLTFLIVMVGTGVFFSIFSLRINLLKLQVCILILLMIQLILLIGVTVATANSLLLLLAI